MVGHCAPHDAHPLPPSLLQVESWIHEHPKIPLTCHNPFPARIAFRALYAVVGAHSI